MKRTAIILLTFVYTISTAGVVWSNFYCCGKLKQTYFFSLHSANKTCGMNGMMRDCCKTKTFFAKVKDNHTTSNQLKATSARIIELLYCLINAPFNSPDIRGETHLLAYLNAPPDINKRPVYLDYCVFRV